MKPAPFEYFAPRSLPEALELLNRYGDDARLLAGGQSLIASLNFRCLRPKALIDLNRVAGLDGLAQQPDGTLLIGALNRHRTLEFDPLVERAAPLLHEAAPYIAHPPIRTRGTLGGSLAYADPAAEWCAVTLALGARYRAASLQGERWIDAQDFFRNTFVTALRPDEALVEVALPPLREDTGWAIVESARRQGDRVMMGVAALVSVDERGVCSAARLVYMNAAPIPQRAERTAALLVDQAGTPEVFAAAVQACQAEIDPPGDAHASSAFRRHLAGELTERALERAFSRARTRLTSKNGNGKYG